MLKAAGQDDTRTRWMIKLCNDVVKNEKIPVGIE